MDPAIPDLRPAALLETLDPTPEAPDPIVIPRETWRQLIQTAHAESRDHIWIWSADGIYRISKIWIGHPEISDHWQHIIRFGGETN